MIRIRPLLLASFATFLFVPAAAQAAAADAAVTSDDVGVDDSANEPIVVLGDVIATTELRLPGVAPLGVDSLRAAFLGAPR